MLRHSNLITNNDALMNHHHLSLEDPKKSSGGGIIQNFQSVRRFIEGPLLLGKVWDRVLGVAPLGG